MEIAVTQNSPSDAETFPSWPLRLAQQAFAAVLEAANGRRELETARLRTLARNTLSILSADDRGRLQGWLNLQLRTTHEGFLARNRALLATLDSNSMPGGRNLALGDITRVMTSPSQVGIAA